MSKKSIEDKFSKEIDNYLNGIEKEDKSDSKEYDELLNLSKTLIDKDYSLNSNKKDIKNKVVNNYKGEGIMKKINKMKRPAIVVALVCVIGISFMQTSFAKDFIEKVINRISLGGIVVEQTEPMDKDIDLTEEFKNKTKKEQDIDTDIEKLIVRDTEELNKYTCFNVILPNYLPKGYKFNRAEFYKEKNKAVKDTKYIDIFFKNDKTGKEIFMQQRFSDEETAYILSTESEIKSVKINGIDAIIVGGRNIDWETDTVLYSISGKGVIGEKELINMAKSILDQYE
ncbi:DUF4367 domain-containing protein [Dethiothermospora halolimnae]|uniref:DUF4367 domain-containing protein n=1 Tax=Dethiothermospora halolimnae TaxID=3114390 RepID=UPI003CCB8FA0